MKAKGTTSTDPILSVLGYREDGEWVALALEMDLRGYGDTPAEAEEELKELVFAQFSFAAFKGQPELIWKRAEPQYWKMFADAKRASIQEFSLGSVRTKPERQATGLAVPPAHVIAKLAKEPHLEA